LRLVDRFKNQSFSYHKSNCQTYGHSSSLLLMSFIVAQFALGVCDGAHRLFVMKKGRAAVALRLDIVILPAISSYCACLRPRHRRAGRGFSERNRCFAPNFVGGTGPTVRVAALSAADVGIRGRSEPARAFERGGGKRGRCRGRSRWPGPLGQACDVRVSVATRIARPE